MHIPESTYRIQFHHEFGFKKLTEILEYLKELGISDIYASPVFKARKGSMHGYDVVEPNLLNPELGSEEDFYSLLNEVKKFSMGWLQDIVPNHMAFDAENGMLMDVMEKGRFSKYYDYFDIEWNHPYDSIKERLLAPFLGRFYSECLEEGEIRLSYDSNGLCVNYYNLRFPLRTESYEKVFSLKLKNMEEMSGVEHHDFIKLTGIINLMKTDQDGDGENRFGQINLAKDMLWQYYNEHEYIKNYIDHIIDSFNGEKGNAASFNLLDDLLKDQHFRLCFWKVAAEETNYRRFFSINELITLKIEKENVFNHTHDLIFKLLDEGKIWGLRIDHIDGLYDPASYLKRLREKGVDSYIVVEKILELEEFLPANWGIHGSTGYDFMNYVNEVLCDEKSVTQFNKLYYRFSGLTLPYEELVTDKKRLIIEKEMGGDIDNLAHLMKKISSGYKYGYDITLYGLRRALVEVMTFFPVYRTYINEENFSEADSEYMLNAITVARRLNPGLIYEINFIEMFLLLRLEEHFTEEESRRELKHFVMKFQQFTGPLMAKGFEDTTLYIYNRLLSLNEVGSSPNRFGISIDEFHQFNTKRASQLPHSMNATATHDTKRGEDVRARLNVLSEIPREWEKKLQEWSRLNRAKKRFLNNIMVPDKNDEYFLYQTLLGAFPFITGRCAQAKVEKDFVNRIKEYVIKAVREAKVHTNWIKPDVEYEEAYLNFIEKILKSTSKNKFLKSFTPFVKKLSFYGILNSLSQTVLKITSPGAPDFYQGTELWDLSLVDPDNRRAVDYSIRREMLSAIKENEGSDIPGLIDDLFSKKEEGGVKLFLIYRALKARNENPDLFKEGSYIPLNVTGLHKNHIIAFARNSRDNWLMTVAPRFFTALVSEDENPVGHELWDDTIIELPVEAPRLWRDVFTGERTECGGFINVGDIINHFPVSIIVNEKA